MNIKLTAENPFEWIALKANLVPLPLIETQIYFTMARMIMAGAELGIYDAIGKDSLSAEQIAQKCNTHVHATRQLLNALTGAGYIRYSGNTYAIPKKFQKWLLKESEANLIGKLRFQILEWNYLNHLEEFVRTGKSLDLHDSKSLDSKAWELYQEGMRDLSVNAAKELAGKIPVPKGANQMLDIGGSHGLYSIELCKKHTGLKSTILELSDAVESASAIAKRYDQAGIMVSYKAGNVLTDELGENLYDVVMINNVVHHFTVEQNEQLAKKIYHALKPGGIYVVGELIRTDTPGKGGIMAAATGLYFSLTSQSGNWSESEISGWQTKAGLKHLKTMPAMTVPGFKMVIGKK
jgi:2-polyprenyl-3-methyl-5-hydroxy-6-metoxy-1,4-benzoquinol methylase